MLGPMSEAYLVDWGIAARLDPDGALRVPLAGTPAYMAPVSAAPGVSSAA